MEEDLSFIGRIKKEFECKEVDIRTYSPLTLAYIGDAIYDLLIRTVVVERGNRAASSLHKSSSRLVNAGMQAAMAEVLFGELTEEEQTIYKRGRNAKSYTSAKNASISDYRKATGLEALFGFLYLTGQSDRILFLVNMAFHLLNVEL